MALPGRVVNAPSRPALRQPTVNPERRGRFRPRRSFCRLLVANRVSRSVRQPGVPPVLRGFCRGSVRLFVYSMCPLPAVAGGGGGKLMLAGGGGNTHRPPKTRVSSPVCGFLSCFVRHFVHSMCPLPSAGEVPPTRMIYPRTLVSSPVCGGGGGKLMLAGGGGLLISSCRTGGRAVARATD